MSTIKLNQLYQIDCLNNNEVRFIDIVMFRSKQKGYCFASNPNLAKSVRVHERTIQRYIRKLIDMDILREEIIRGKNSFHVVERRLFVCVEKLVALFNEAKQAAKTKLPKVKKQKVQEQKQPDPIEVKHQPEEVKSVPATPVVQKEQPKQTPIQNSINKQEVKSVVNQVVYYLNQKANKNFKPNNTFTFNIINQRLNEGYTLEDFKIVIDNKVGSWLKDSKMSTFLQPSTLFGDKMDNYLNEKSINNNQSNKQLNAFGEEEEEF